MGGPPMAPETTTPGAPVTTTPGAPVTPTPGAPVTTTPGAPLAPETTTPKAPVTTTPGVPVTTTPLAPVETTTPAAPIETTTPLAPVETTTPKLSRCMFNGMDFDRPAPNNQWSYNCTICKCVNGQSSCEKACLIESCPKGEKLVTDVADDECCRCETEEPMCKYEGLDYEVGSNWTDGECTTCNCDYSAGVECTDLRDSCDAYSTCDLATHELKFTNESACCPQCFEKPEPPKGGCNPVNVTQQLETADGCVSDGNVELTSCGGACASNTVVLPYSPFLETNCHCCQPVDVEEREIEMLCPGGSKTTLKIPVIQSCGCSECTGGNN